MWQFSRLLLLESLVGGQRQPADTQQAARAVVHRFVAELRRYVLLDWQRVKEDIRWQAGVPFTWLQARDPRMSRQRFASKWCRNGVVARLVDDDEDTAVRMQFRLTAAGW